MFNIKKIIINIAVFVLNIIYLPFKLCRTKNKVTFISRQANIMSIDFELLTKKLMEKRPDVKQVILTKKIGKGIICKIKYGFHIFIQMYHIATSKVVIVDTYIIPVSVLKHKKELKVIQIWHALGAVKKFGYQVLEKGEGSTKTVAYSMKMHNNYDIVTAASNITAKFYSEAFNTDISKISICGMPRIDYILDKDKNKEILKENPKYKNKKTILYIPTFRKNKNIYLADLVNKVDTKKYNLIIRLHPLDKTVVEQKYIVKGEFSTYDLMKFADYIITDYSATSIEASILEKQLFIYAYDLEEYNELRGLNIDIISELKSYTSKNIEDILKIIKNNSYNYNELKQFKNKYVETCDINNTERICNIIEENLEN